MGNTLKNKLQTTMKLLNATIALGTLAHISQGIAMQSLI